MRRSRAIKPAWWTTKLTAEPMSVVVVTDSSSRLPDDMRQRWGIRQVPLHILLGGRDLRDGVDPIPDNIYECGEATTAAATPVELYDAYRRALAVSGGEGVVAVHLSAALSGTLRAAETTAAELGPSIRVIDSKSTAMNTGFVALAAARAAADGADLDTVANAARTAAQRAYRRRCGAAGQRAGAQAAAAHRQRQTRTGATCAHRQQGAGSNGRPGLRGR